MKHSRLIAPLVLAFLVVASVSITGKSNAKSSPPRIAPTPSDYQALRLADPHAALIASLSLAQLQATKDLLLKQFPQSKGSVALLTLAGGTLLGFNPFATNAWSTHGFDTGARVLLQVASTNQTQQTSSSPWRARIVLRAHAPRLAKAALLQLRFSQRALLQSGKASSPLQALLGLESSTAKALHAQLLASGVMFIARPSAVPGLLVFSRQKNLFVVDYLPSAPPKDLPLKLLGWLTEPLKSSLPNSATQVLRTQFLGMWMQPKQVAHALRNQETYQGIAPRNSSCQSLVQLSEAGEFASLSLRAQLKVQETSLDLRWHLQPKSSLSDRLALQTAPLQTHSNQALHLAVHLASLGGFRSKAPLDSKAWDLLWRNLEQCAPTAKSLALLFAWPEILGLFLSELSALHGQAGELINHLGPISATAIGLGQEQELQVETWIAKAGTAIARRWLKAIFGRERQVGAVTRWGSGPMRPYALDRKQGDILGAYLGSGSAPFAVRGHKERDTQPTALAQFQIRPKAVQNRLLDQVAARWLRAWTSISGRLSFASDTLRFTLTLKTD